MQTVRALHLSKSLHCRLAWGWPLAAGLLALTGCSGSGDDLQAVPGVPEGTMLKMAVLATTDSHQNVIGYNYFSLSADPSVGMDRAATLIKGTRLENPNNVLLDNGDTIEGTLLGDFQTLAQPIPCSQTLAIHKVMKIFLCCRRLRPSKQAATGRLTTPMWHPPQQPPRR